MTSERASTGYEDPPYRPDPHTVYDPVNNAEDAAKLSYYWLPSRPDPNKQPELYAHWEEMFWPPPKFVLAESTEPPHPIEEVVLRQPSFEGLSGRLESSQNWSGAYLEPREANRFSRVVGAWTVPSVKPGVRQESDLGKQFRFSIWIGLDGKKGWTNSMPQVGTEHKLTKDDGTQEDIVWWQWWIRDEDKPEWPRTMKGIAVKPGDRVLCSMSVMDPKYVRIHVVNRTTGLFTTVQLKGPKPLVGATAEWVVERQSNVYIRRDFLYPVPDYSEVTFDKCAVENVRTTTPAPPWVPRYIRMTETFKKQRRVAVISTPSTGEEPRKVRLTYRRPAID